MAPPAGKSGDENAIAADHEFTCKLLRETRQEHRLARAFLLVAGIEPVPAPLWIGGSRLLRIGNDKAKLIRQFIHAGTAREVIRVLRAAVQHDDEGEPLGPDNRRERRAYRQAIRRWNDRCGL